MSKRELEQDNDNDRLLTRVYDKQEKKMLYVKTKYLEDNRFVYDHELIYFKAKGKDRYINIDKNPELLEVKA